MAHNIEHLRAGDILLGGGHTMMYVGGEQMVHAIPQSGLVRVDMMDGRSHGHWDAARVYRPRIDDLGTLAARYAASWAPTTSGAATRYGPDTGNDEVINNRGTGVKQQLKLGVAAPFLYDAFYRSFKWALRYKGVFSEDRGTTCCAVIIAAYHAASVMYWTKGDTPHERMERISLAYEFLRKHRGAKNVPSFVKQTSQGTLVNKAFPEISNRGQDRSDGRMEFFNLSSEILRALSGQEVTLEQVYTRALLVDAKFTYSSVLEARLKEHTGGWIPNVFELEYDPDQDPYSKLSISERLMRGLM